MGRPATRRCRHLIPFLTGGAIGALVGAGASLVTVIGLFVYETITKPEHEHERSLR